MQNFETKKRSDDRTFQDIFSKEYSQDALEKQRRFQEERQAVIAKEQERIRKAQMDLEFERQRVMENKLKTVTEQKEALRKQEEERRKLIIDKEQEKYKDKEAIERNIREMEAKEKAYHEFYRKRQDEQEKKLKNFIGIANEKQVYEVEKRNREYENIIKERAALKEQIEKGMRDKAMYEMKTELDRQIEARRREKEFIDLESQKEQERARNNARQNDYQNALAVDRRLREKRELQQALERQLLEKQQNYRSNEQMDDIEKEYHKNLLKMIDGQSKIAFPGVPGVNSTESPLKQQFAKAHLRNAVETSEPSYRSANRNSYQSPDQRTAKSVEGRPGEFRKNIFSMPDPNKHDPITNPIGTNGPRILPGQRMPKAGGSYSKLAFAANSIFG